MLIQEHVVLCENTFTVLPPRCNETVSHVWNSILSIKVTYHNMGKSAC